MNKNDFAPQKIQGLISEAAWLALENGKGTRAVGMGGNGITVGNTYKLLSVGYRENLFPNNGVSDDDFNKMSEEEKAKNGHMNDWFEFETSNGALSFTAVLGNVKMYTENFWFDVVTDKDGNTTTTVKEGVEVADDFDPAKLFKPSCQTPKAFIKNGCDDLFGKTLRCVATKVETINTRNGEIEVKTRAFVIE